MTLKAFNHLVPEVVIVLRGEVNVSPSRQTSHEKASGQPRAVRNPQDDARLESAFGPAQGLPRRRVSTFTNELYDEAKK
jgi:hypothetical protein